MARIENTPEYKKIEKRYPDARIVELIQPI
jgi:hypothetical protein